MIVVSITKKGKDVNENVVEKIIHHEYNDVLLN